MNGKKIILVSLNGIGNKGGVERVSWYLNEILTDHFDNVQVLTRGKLMPGKIGNLIWPVLLSLKLCFIRNKIVIANSWHCFLYPAELSIHHGTMAGAKLHTTVGGAAGITAFMEKVSARKAKKILAVSINCKNELESYYKINPNKIEVLNNFVNEEVFFPKEESNAGSEDNKIINVLFSGSLDERKGLPKLIEFSKYIEDFKGPYQIKFTIASNTKDAYHFFEGLNNTKIVSGLGVEQMPDFYRAGDVLIFPTNYEGFSMSTMEALASGLSVIGTDFAIPDEIKDFAFCLRHDFSDISKTVEEIIRLYKTWHTQKAEIASKTIQNFGKKQYEEKFINYTKSAMTY
ncbi:Glycosyl transferases group 1 [Treponema bryantii]|uniref:Glycosyl transferases group 1 n=1 Tax=Treponema bryantii TaxID=163 RepID=A0A1I3MFD6_9SPIR|nr:glycosyltransferase family 4 protein [Treponema bryantii]SFI95739.1 Glycosyl transferases group 1 [Treponema bryantii]